jgi:MFS family permease
MARTGTLPIVLTGVFITILDFFIVNVAVPSIQSDLHASTAAVQWTVAGYGLAYGSGLILGGRLGDIFGRRRMFAFGLALFTLASVACGLVPALAIDGIGMGLALAPIMGTVLARVAPHHAGPPPACSPRLSRWAGRSGSGSWASFSTAACPAVWPTRSSTGWSI